MIDLHTHTTASDGTLTPSQLVELGKKIGLTALAVTDHDTLDGLPEALARGRELGYEVIRGLEISAEFKPGSMHILGYFIDGDAYGLSAKIEALKDSRANRNPRIAARLTELGYPVSMMEVTAAAGGGQVGRPHFAKVMVDKGYVASIHEAFDRFLTKGGPAYMDKFRFYPDEAIALIRAAHGVPVLGHPFTLGLAEPEAFEAQIAQLTELGLLGLEVYYPEHTPEMIGSYLYLARKYNLAITGGSDFHGANKENVMLGSGRGDLDIPDELLGLLKEKRTQT